MAIKRTLTTMQITQFLIGASYAMLHSFVSYTVPVTVYTSKSAAAATAAATESATSSAAEAAATVAAGALENLKNMVFGASAKVAEEAASVSVAAAAAAPPQPGFIAETVYVTQPCITTSGETFAIWLNVFYLAPLTYLFVMFFIRSYLRRSSAESAKGKGKARRESNVTMAEKAGWDAARDVNREIYNGSAEYAVDGGSPRRANGKTNNKARA